MTQEVSEDTKECPFCAEPIKREAVKCKHCGSNLGESSAAPDGELRKVLAKEASASSRLPAGRSYCTNCATEVSDKAVACTKCGASPKVRGKFCGNCAGAVESQQVICVKCGVPVAGQTQPAQKSKTTAAVLAFLLGGIGVHMFYLGSWGWGLVYLCFFWTYVPAILAFIQFIMYLCMDNAKFQTKYCLDPPSPFKW